ncbi:MAG TPA: hypothetical protein VLJ59_06020 [Mycobacteriales bacterium]|nr:hypothetical protein [Mycobacteriales bacterium]
MTIGVWTTRVDEDGDRVTADSGRQQPSVAHSTMLSFAGCLGARDRSEVYLSAPITTGELFVAWRQSAAGSLDRDHPDYPELHREHVMATNIARVAPLVGWLRDAFAGRLVIDPTVLADVPGWRQQDYHDFWCALIRRYVDTVVFADGWQYSHGCVAEFATAVSVGARLLTERLENLDLARAVELVGAAVARLESVGEDTSKLRGWLASAGLSLPGDEGQ